MLIYPYPFSSNEMIEDYYRKFLGINSAGSSARCLFDRAALAGKSIGSSKVPLVSVLSFMILFAPFAALVVFPAQDAIATFPGTNGKMAFISFRDGGPEVYSMNADGTGQTRLTNNVDEDYSPDWSPDGTRIAFVSDRDGVFEVYSMNADGTGQTRLTTSSISEGKGDPAWSPDGTKIAFISLTDGSNYEIYVMNADGTGQTRLTNNTADDFNPDWSPDGTKIAFLSERDGNEEIYVMNADGTGQTRLTNNTRSDQDPSWSPDGTKIAFASNSDSLTHEIHVMNDDGTGQTRLTNNTTNELWPSWSPDGTKIAFISDRDGNREIYVMNSDGTGQTRLTSESARDDMVDFGPQPQSNFSFEYLSTSSIEPQFMNQSSTVEIFVETQFNGTGIDVPIDEIFAVAEGPLPSNITANFAEIFPVDCPEPLNEEDPLICFWESGPLAVPSAAVLPDGEYILNFEVTQLNSTFLVEEELHFFVDRVAPFLSGVTDSPDPFSPNNDGFNDNSTISFLANETGSYVIELYNASGLVDSFGDGMVIGLNEAIWEPFGLSVGTYNYTVTGTDAAENSYTTPIQTITIDNAFALSLEGKIAFTSHRDGNQEIYVMNADGTVQTRLTNNAASDIEPSFSPDGSKIAFTSFRDGNSEIYVMNADGTVQTRLTNNTALDQHPSWSVDGNMIAFETNRDGDFEIYVMNADGTGQINVSNNIIAPFFDAFPSWSDFFGTDIIIFTSDRDGNQEIYKMNSDGTALTRLTNNAAFDAHPSSIAANGTTIAFDSTRDGNLEIYRMNSDGTAQTRLTNNAASDAFPSWSPDYSSIAFTRGAAPTSQIYVMNADGTGQINVSNNAFSDSDPSWSITATDSDAPIITAISDSPDPFSPNGDSIDDTTTISFTSNETGSFSVMILTLSDGPVRNLTAAMAAGGNNISWDGLMHNSTLAPDGIYKYTILAMDGAGNFRPIGPGEDGTITLDTSIMSFDKAIYNVTDIATVTLGSQLANSDSSIADIVSATVTSTTDPVGIQIALEETGSDTAIFFFDDIKFTTTGSSDNSTKTLLVSPGDTITATFSEFSEFGVVVTANAAIEGDGGSPSAGISVTTDKAAYTTGEIVLVTGNVSDIINATQVVSVSSIGLTDILGNPVEFQPGLQSVITFDVNNLSNSSQEFAATVQVRKSDGSPEQIVWQTGTLAGSGTVQVGLSWTPEADDTYTIRVLVFSNLTSPQPLFPGATYDVQNDTTTFDSDVPQAFLRVFNPSGVNYRFDQAEVLGNGSLSYSFPLGGFLAEAGSYTLTAAHGGNSANATFALLPATISILVSDTSPAWGEDVFTNVTVTGAKAGDYVVVSKGNGETFAYPAFAGNFSGSLDLTVFAYNDTDVGGIFDVSATLFDSSNATLATSNTIQVIPDRRNATLALSLPTGVVNGTIFTASGSLADEVTGFGLPGRTIAFTVNPAVSLGSATTDGIEVSDASGIEIISCQVPECTPDNPNASSVNLLALNPGASLDLPAGVTAMALTLQNMSGTVTVELTRSDNSVETATSDPAGLGIATLVISARDSDHMTQFLQSVEILSTSVGEQFATSKIELYDLDADPTTLVSATFDQIAAGNYGTSLSVAPGSYYSSAVAPVLAMPEILVTAHFAGDALYNAVEAESSFATVLGFPLSAGTGTLPSVSVNNNPTFTIISCSAQDPDLDGDGLCNSWEDPAVGIPFACGASTCHYPLPETKLPGTDIVQTTSPEHKDIFIEIDAMEGQAPLDGALRRVVDAFAAAPVDNPDGVPGITLHIIKDSMNLPFVGSMNGGPEFSAWVDTIVDESGSVTAGDDGNNENDYFGVKSVQYGTTVEERTNGALKNARANAILYSLWVSTIGSSTMSGLAEDLGNDQIISLGGFGGAVNPNGGKAGTETEQAATFMHELGHMLNLKHGGPAEIITQVDGTQTDVATKPSGSVRTSYPRETTLSGYTLTTMGPGNGTIKLQQVVELTGGAAIGQWRITEDPSADQRLGSPSVSFNLGASTSTKKVLDINYPFSVPYINPVESIDYAVDFGTSSTKYLQAPAGVFDVGVQQDFWMAGMFKRTSDSGTTETIISKKSNYSVGNKGYIVEIANDIFRAVISDGTAQVVVTSSAPAISLNVWYAWALSVDRSGAATLYLYKSDTPTPTLTVNPAVISSAGNSLTNANSFTVGQRSNAVFFPGQMDNLNIMIGGVLPALTQNDFSNFVSTGILAGQTPTSKYDFNARNTDDAIFGNDLAANGFPTFPPRAVDASIDNTISEMSLGTLTINFAVSKNVDIKPQFGTPAYPTVTEILPQDNSMNCKPNYQSVLSYSRQMDNYLNMEGEHLLDYSRGNYAPLVESGLDEDLGLFSRDVLRYPYNVVVYGSPDGVADEDKFQKGQAHGPGVQPIPIDWDATGIAGGTTSANINNLSITGCNTGDSSTFDAVTFYDYNDWNNIKLDWKENTVTAFDGMTRAAQKAAVEMTSEIDAEIKNQVTTVQVDTLTDDKILYNSTISVTGSSSSAPEGALLSIDWGDGTVETFTGAIDPQTGGWPASGLLNHTYGPDAIGERRIVASLKDSVGIEIASSSGTTILILKDRTTTSLTVTPSLVSETQQFTLTGTLSNLDHPGHAIAGRNITFTTSDPSLTIASAVTDASGDFVQTAIAGSVGSFEIVAHFEPSVDAEEVVSLLSSQSDPQTLSVGETLFSGVLSPINQDGTSVFKQKRTVPIRFQLTDGAGNFITDAEATLRVVKISSGVSGTEEEAAFAGTASSGSVFLYDAETNEYYYNLGTKNMSLGTWGIKIYLNYGTPTQTLLDTDGDGYTVRISLSK